jgi:hypothetical protein
MTKGERNKDKVKKREINKKKRRENFLNFLNLSTQIGGASS